MQHREYLNQPGADCKAASSGWHWILQHPRLSRGEKIVALSLARHQNSSGECWPSLRRLCELSGYHRRSLLRVLHNLQTHGVLIISPRRGRASFYSLVPPVASVSPVTPIRPVIAPVASVSPTHRLEATTPVASVSPRSQKVKAKKKPKKKPKKGHASPSPLAFSGVHLRITKTQDLLLGDAFPWVDREREYAKMDSWLEANPNRRPKKQARFAQNWFAKIPPPRQATSQRGLSRFESAGIKATDLRAMREEKA